MFSSEDTDSDNDMDMVNQLLQHLQLGKQNLLQPSTPSQDLIRSCTSKFHVQRTHMMFLYSKQNQQNNPQGNFKTTATSTSGYVPFTKKQDVRLTEENRVDIETLVENLNTVMVGKFFLCRTISPAGKLVAIQVVVEEPVPETGGQERAVHLSLYNFSTELTPATDLEDVLPRGAFLAVKNPYFKSSVSGMLALRCDNPADVEFLSWNFIRKTFPGMKWPRPEDIMESFTFWKLLAAGRKRKEDVIGNELKALGNKTFIAKLFPTAVRWYNVALDYVKEKENQVTILSNKAAALLSMGCYHAALKCAETALKLDPAHVKAIYRKAKAQIGLKEYENTWRWLDRKLGENPTLKESKELLVLCDLAKQFCERAKSGLLTPEQKQEFYKILTSKTFKSENIPEFKGPVTIQHIEGKGRGLVATEDIQRGQILICSKAVAYYKGECLASFSFNHGTNSYNVKPGHDVLVGRMANQIFLDPQLGPGVYELTAGKEHGHYLQLDDGRNKHVDMKRIDQLLILNSFGSGSGGNSFKEFSQNLFQEEWSGLWLLPSFINHSCSEANCVWRTYEDVMVVTATHPIKKGEEVLCAYVSPIWSYKERQCTFKSHEFTCNCKLCQLDSAEDRSITKQREKIMERLEGASSNKKKIKQAVQDIMTLISLRKDHSTLNMQLLQRPVFTILETMFNSGHYKDCLKILLKMQVPANASTHCCDVGIEITQLIARCYIAISDLSHAKYIHEIKESFNTFYGSNSLGWMSPSGVQMVEELQHAFNKDFFKY